MERILDAAAELFVSKGFDATTTDEIAERAETSVGSIYQFFPNKRAIFDAIAARHLEDAFALFESFIGTDPMTAAWRELLARLIDGYAAYHRKNLGFRALLLNWKLSPEFLEAGEKLNREFARRAAEMFAVRTKHVPKEKLAAAATLATEVTSAVFVQSVRMTDEESDALFAELKIMLERYLAAYLDAPKRRKKVPP